MGNRFEKKRSEVKDVKEVGERIKIDRTTLRDEYAVMASIDSVMSEIDDEIANAINEVKAVGEREDDRLETEHQENVKEKGRVANEISDELGKLEKGTASLEAAHELPFGKKSVEQARRDYKEQSDKYEQLLDELGEGEDEKVDLGSRTSRGIGSSLEGARDNKENDSELSESQSEVGGTISDWISDTFSNSSNYDYIVGHLSKANVEYRPLQIAHGNRTNEDIINRLSGGDLTQGSCSSLALAYAGNIAGFDVLDFRDGASRDFFSSRDSIKKIASLPMVRSVTLSGTDDIASANQLMRDMAPGKEYYLATGQHAAIIRNTGNGYEYLELQHPSNGNGWHELNDYILTARFGASRNHSVSYSNFMIEVESLTNSQEFLNILGYINTAESAQAKGVAGNVR
ncbi:hypothetical protein [Butyrivibrio sp. AC2005]|uniref:hypothetical protein n=1 Tax=Butyrivibrio sp. AC2005 TaxID=1280672 RepID=UPI00041F19B7|nr:hypothetical protein [Butyrivibrio sp. AC2005]